MAESYEVVSGDCLSSIAAKFHMSWRRMWDDPANAELKRIRKNPNVLLPGDRLTIPSISPATFTVATGRVHRFVIKKPEPTLLRLVIRSDGEPMANASFRLTVDATQVSGVTDGDGLLEARIPATAKTAKVV